MKSAHVLPCILFLWHVANAYRFRKNEMSLTPQVKIAERFVDTGSTVEEECSSKGHRKTAIDCCFKKEGERQKGNLWTNWIGPVVSIIPGVDKLGAIGEWAANSIGTLAEAGAAHAVAVDDIDADDCVEKAMRANLNEIKEIQRQVKKVSAKVETNFREIKKTQRQLARVERKFLAKTDNIIKSANALAAKLDRLNLRVIENGQRLAQSTFYQVSIQFQTGIAVVTSAYNTLVELAAERNRYRARLTQAFTESKEKNKQLVDEWKSFKILQANALLNVWALAQTSFGKVAAVLSEGNFFGLHINQLIQNEVGKFLTGLDGIKNGCAKVFEKANMEALINKIHLVLSAGDPTVSSIAVTIIHAVSISQVGARGISANEDFVNNVNKVISSLEAFKADMSSSKSDGAFSVIVAKVLGAVLPTVCRPSPVCRAAAVQAGYSQTDDMLVWSTAAEAKSEDELPTITIANNPTCLLVDDDCQVSMFLCTPIPRTKVARDKNDVSIKDFWQKYIADDEMYPLQNKYETKDMQYKKFTMDCGEGWYLDGEEEICKDFVIYKPEFIKAKIKDKDQDVSGHGEVWCTYTIKNSRAWKAQQERGGFSRTKTIMVAEAELPSMYPWVKGGKNSEDVYPQTPVVVGGKKWNYKYGLPAKCKTFDADGWCVKPIFAEPKHKWNWKCVHRKWKKGAELGQKPCTFTESIQSCGDVRLTRRNLLQPADKLSTFVAGLRKVFDTLFSKQTN